MNFDTYLQQQFKSSTQQGIQRTVHEYTQWCVAMHVEAPQATYSELLDYMKHCASKGHKTTTVNRKINNLHHYFNWLKHENKRADSPLLNVRLRNATRLLPCEALPYDSIEKLYTSYEAHTLLALRNKTMIGLMVYQGLNSSELVALEVKDIKLEEGTIYIPSTRRSNSRVLKLEAKQILGLQNYILTTRLALIKESSSNSSIDSSKLFVFKGVSKSVHNHFHGLLLQLQQLNSGVKKLEQLRVSVLAHWYKHHHSREVQYRIGHKYVSSTERYRTDKLESLQEQLEKIHPMR